MDRLVPTVIVVAVIVLAFVGMYGGWRARQRRQSTIPAPQAVPIDIGSTVRTADALYIATTSSGDPLDRITVRGLGYRARAHLTVTDLGIVVVLKGEHPIFIPKADLRKAVRATWVIDEGVEPGGLLLIGWVLGTFAVDSYLRIDGSSESTIESLIDEIDELIGGKK